MNKLGHISAWLRRWLGHRHLPWHLALLAVALCVPSLGLGWQFDDHFHRAALTRPDLPLLTRSPAELFVFIEGDEATNRRSMKMGMLPWWSSEDLRLAFFRPLTGFTHWVDYQIWPRFPSLMHLHSLVWFGGVVVAAAFLYRRMHSSAWVAGLAALLFAVDDAHGLPAAWLANRNALIGVFFGLLTLIAHDQWRRDGRWLGAVLAPLALLLGLLSKESTLATGAYLLAYALFLDRGTWVGRLRSLIPCTLVGALWWVTYKELGYGVIGSGWYIDPGADPVQFAGAVAVRAPALLAWQWLVPSDLQWTLSDGTAHVMWLAAMGFLVIMAVALAPLLKRNSLEHSRISCGGTPLSSPLAKVADPGSLSRRAGAPGEGKRGVARYKETESALARFWALGMVLSVLPACTAYPADRLLSFVGIGGMGLLAQFVAVVIQKIDRPLTGPWRHLPAGALCVVLIFIHLGMAPLALARTTGRFESYGRALDRVAASLPSNTAGRFQTTLIVNSPTWATFTFSVLKRFLYGDPYLSRTLVLGSGSQPIEIHRPDERTLLVRPAGGFLAPLGNPHSNREVEQVLFDQRRAFLTLDRLYRDQAPMTIGQRIGMLGVTAEITALTDDGRPAEAAFRFALKLENPLFRWLQWADGAYVPFGLPRVGETMTLPAVTMRY